MIIQYLGTAAAEGIPALFCQCGLCKKAERAGGKEIRTRSGVLINDTILIDFSPDIYLHKLRYGLDLSVIEHIFVTHSHTDHFDGAELTKRSSNYYCHTDTEKPLQVYGNSNVCRLGSESLLLEFGHREDSSLQFHVLEPYQSIQAGNIRFTPIPAIHDNQESCFIYLAQQGDSAFLYGNDTSLLSQETFDYLSGIKLDLVSLDCTFGTAGNKGKSHMGFGQNREFVRQLRIRGCLGPDTQIYLTHFSHNCGMSHQELELAAKEYDMKPAYDGLVLEI